MGLNIALVILIIGNLLLVLSRKEEFVLVRARA